MPAEGFRALKKLSERIILYGKIRFLFVCDENLGRSPMVEAVFNSLLRKAHLDSLAEGISAGTDVLKEKSHQKYGGRAHPKVRQKMKRTYRINIDRHLVEMLKRKHVTENTIAIILNDPKKLPEYVKTESLLVIGHNVSDPYSEDVSLSGALSLYGSNVLPFSRELIARFAEAVKKDDLSVFRKYYQSQLI